MYCKHELLNWELRSAGLCGGESVVDLRPSRRGRVPNRLDAPNHIPHAIEFMAVSSYGVGKRESEGQVRITLDLNTNIFDKDVLLVEDIIDSGRTVESVLKLLSVRKPKSVEVCVLLDKAETPARLMYPFGILASSFPTSSCSVTA